MKRAIIISGIYLLTAVIPASAQDGKEIFNTYCTSCHTIGKGLVVGPDLKGSHKKYKEKWLKKWIKSSQTMVQENDPKAVELFNQFNQIVMPDQPLSDAEISAVISFIKTESGDGAAPATAATEATTTQPAAEKSTASAEPVAENVSAPAAAENPAIVKTEGSNIANVVTGGPYEAPTGSIMSGKDFFSTLWISVVAIFFLAILAVMAKVIFSLSAALHDKQENRNPS
jgi:mono/diheme cytochrome c family protein